jgi:hypothetical protein
MFSHGHVAQGKTHLAENNDPDPNPESQINAKWDKPH